MSGATPERADVPAPPQALRTFPDLLVSGTSAWVCIVPTATEGVWALGLEESPPAGWTVLRTDNGGAWDPVHEKVKWGPFFQPFPHELCYELQVPTNATARACFAGTVSFDGTNQAVGGVHCVLLDRDADGVDDQKDNCPSVANADQGDWDVDGVGDACDNCPEVPDDRQDDMDGDGHGDACDADIDGDGVDNEADRCSGTPADAWYRVIDDAQHPLLGTVPCDLDGDCDCDMRDWALMLPGLSGPGPSDQRLVATSECLVGE